MYTKTYIYIVCQNLDLYHIAKLRFINLAFGMRYQFRF
jgi:hypothetical protein